MQEILTYYSNLQAKKATVSTARVESVAISMLPLNQDPMTVKLKQNLPISLRHRYDNRIISIMQRMLGVTLRSSGENKIQVKNTLVAGVY